MRPREYRLNVEVSGIEELKEACKEVSKKAEELQEAIKRLSEIEIEATADCVRADMELIGKYLEISGNIAGRIELETEKDLLVRRAMVIDGHIGLCEQAVYVDKKVLDSYWVKIVELSAIPETINSVDSTDLVRKWLNM